MLMIRHLAAVAVLTVGGVHAAAPEPVPERLDDREFWALVTSLSEPGGYFRSDNFISNEGELQYPIPELQRSIPKGRAYVGVGPEQNLTYIAALEPSIAFIVDIRRQNLVQHLMLKALMETSPDRATFLSRLFARPRPEGLDSTSTVTALMEAFAKVAADSSLHHRTREEVERHLTVTRGWPLSPEDLESLRYVSSAFAQAGVDITYSFGQMGNGRFGGWMPTLAEMMTETDASGEPRAYLASEALFGKVRELHRRNLIVPVVGDFGGQQALRAVASWLRAHDALLGVFYASNVEQYLFQDGSAAARFYDNLGTFPTDSASTFIRSVAGRAWVPLRNPRSRLAQITMPVDAMLRAIREGRVANYVELVLLRP